MATMTVSLPDPMKEWIEAEIRKGNYASTSDYMRDLIRRDRAWRERDMTIEELRQIIDESRASGIDNRSMDELFAEAVRLAKAHGPVRE